MGFHVFTGLATQPYNLSSKTSFHQGPNENFLFLPHRTSTLLGGARSTRSEFREEKHADSGSRATTVSPGVRVGGTPSGPPEASAKKRESSIGYIRAADISMSKVKKRSLRRAVRRARDGKPAFYRGRQVAHNPLCPSRSVVLPIAEEANRLKIFSWNCSGLTQLLFEELKLYLRLHPDIQVIFLQETHRAYQSEWTADGWTFVHSAADKPNQGGVMMGFRDGFCDKASLRWQEVHPGRLLHVRCFSKKQHLDLVCIYQHALPFEAGALKTTLAKRKQLWNKLDSLLQSFPVRSSVVVAGDFNSNLCSSGSCIGHSVLHNAAKSTVVEERQWLSGLLASHQLTALNSWSRKLPTYWHPSGSSQIDWILVRSSLADSHAKKCTPSDAPVAGWRSAGHKILKASIPLNWMPWKISGSRTEKTLFSSRHEVPDASQLQRVIQEVSGSEVPAHACAAASCQAGLCWC